MHKIIASLLIAFTLFACKQKDKKQAAPHAPIADTTLHTSPAAPASADTSLGKAEKQQTAEELGVRIALLTDPNFLFGDVGHLHFTDMQTRKESEYEWIGDIPEIDKIIEVCGDEGKCPELKGAKYMATMQYKLMDIFDFNGEKLVPTGKKEMRWVMTSLKKMGKRGR